MTWPVIALALAAIALLSLVVMLARDDARTWLPSELNAARLIAVEVDISIDRPYRMSSRPDRIYRTRNGVLVLAELKNRDGFAIHQTDIAEISLRAWMLRCRGKQTAWHGYVVIRDRRTGVRRAKRVELLGDDECIALVERYRAITESGARPRKASGRKCQGCAHLARCHN